MALLGVQEPRLQSVPDGDTSLGDEAVEFARWAGMTLYPWQEDLLRDMCRKDEKGKWSAREVVVPLARQNGKGEVLVARELAGIYLFGEKGIYHSAHLMDTAIDAQKRLWEVIEGNDNLYYWWEDDPDSPGLPNKRTGNGKEKIEFPNGAEIWFRTRTKKTGRGLSVELLIFDECYDLPRETYSAMSKLIRAKPKAQAVYISSPVNREEHFHGDIFSAKRWAGVDGAKRVLFKEWSPDDDDDPFVQSTWAKCNPSMVDEGPGAQLSDIESESIAAKNSSALLDAFMIETLGKGNWVPRDADVGDDFVPLIDLTEWAQRARPMPTAVHDSFLAVDVTPDGESVALVACLVTPDGLYLSLSPHVEFTRSAVVESVKNTVEANDPGAVILDPSGQGSTLVDPLHKHGVFPEALTGAEVSRAYELFLRLWVEGKITHDGDPRWVAALEVATERSNAGRFRSIERFSGDVTVLVAATIAAWGAQEFGTPVEPVKVVRKQKFVGSALRVAKPADSRAMSF
ncbi:hypothetical protein ACEN2D_02240 [Corynebacterium auriscanis]|uniref:hypothetical protein n=1 Tax=Corynebacterium auriscanis TaxID=99807 RepID=UPI003CE7AD4C